MSALQETAPTTPSAGDAETTGDRSTAYRKDQGRPSSIPHRLDKRWNEIQVGRQGSYSVERLESLDHYCRTASRTRVTFVCVLTPLPGLAAALLLECLPLQSPSEGWAANWVFWIRFSLMVFFATFVGIHALVQFVPNFGFTVGKRLAVAFGTTAGYVGTCLLVAATDIMGFPIPFVWQVGGGLVGIFAPMMILILFGLAPFATSSPVRPHLRRYIRLLASYVSLGGVFPLYKLLYESIPETYQVGAVIALPVWKFAAKHFMMQASRDLEDFVPVIVALTVDFFSALFVSVCISSSGSPYLSILFVAVDVVQVLLEFLEVRDNAQTVIELLQNQHESVNYIHQKPNSAAADLLERMIAVTRNPTAFEVVSLKRTRLWACLPHPVTLEQTEQLKVLEASAIYAPRGFVSRRRSSQPHQRSRRLLRVKNLKNTSIVPSSTIHGRSQRSSNAITLSERGRKSRELIRQGLQLLFHCEYLALVEYVECVIPLVVATYKIALKHLPNVIYYPGGAGNWGIAALTNIFVFATLEIGSLLLLHYFLQRKLAFSPLYQLAYVLETHIYFVQSVLFLEIVGLLQYELLHLGADFTFRFEWLHSNPKM